jgi:hypothetical protein
LRAAYRESSVVTSYRETKAPTAIVVTKAFRQTELEMIIV